MKIVFAILLGLCSSVPGFTQVTAIKAGRLIDPDAGTVLTDQVILIDNNKIQAVGKAMPIPSGAKLIDLSSMTVLPGLIDCHTQLADAASDNGDPPSTL